MALEIERGGFAMSELVQPEDIMDDKEKIIHVIATERDQLKVYLEAFSAEIEEKDNTISTIVAERDQLKSCLEAFSAEIEEKDNIINAISAERDQLKTHLKRFSAEVAEKNNVIKAIVTERDQLKTHLESLSADTAEKDNIINVVVTERDQYIGYLEELKQYQTWVPPGHFYSPLPCINDIRQRENTIWGDKPKSFLGIDLNEEEQISMLESLSEYYDTLPFSEEQKEGYRYYFNNSFFGFADGIILYCILQKYRPKRIIEVGSGFSSALMLDVNEYCFMSGGGGGRFYVLSPKSGTLKVFIDTK